MRSGCAEVRRYDSEQGRYTLVFLAAPGDESRRSSSPTTGSRDLRDRACLRPPRLRGGRHLRRLPAADGARRDDQPPAARRPHGVRALAGRHFGGAPAERRRAAAGGAVEEHAEHRQVVAAAAARLSLVSPLPPTMRGSGSSCTPNRSATEPATRWASDSSSTPLAAPWLTSTSACCADTPASPSRCPRQPQRSISHAADSLLLPAPAGGRARPDAHRAGGRPAPRPRPGS